MLVYKTIVFQYHKHYLLNFKIFGFVLDLLPAIASNFFSSSYFFISSESYLLNFVGD